MNSRGNNIVAALAAIHMVIGVYRYSQLLRSQSRNDLIGIHVGAGTRASLENIHGELIVMIAAGYGHCRSGDGVCHGGFQQAQIGIRSGSRGLDQAQTGDEATGQGNAADVEVVDGALRLRSV